MLVVVSYDISTADKTGAKRLYRVCKECLNVGTRVQNSVFECNIDAGTYRSFKKKIYEIIDHDNDSVRFYLLGNNFKSRVETVGCNKIEWDPDSYII